MLFSFPFSAYLTGMEAFPVNVHVKKHTGFWRKILKLFQYEVSFSIVSKRGSRLDYARKEKWEDRNSLTNGNTITAEIHARSLANFLSSICGQTHEFKIRATRQRVRAGNSTICYRKKQIIT